jgi:DNA-binding MarR family transcriptional regulator
MPANSAKRVLLSCPSQLGPSYRFLLVAIALIAKQGRLKTSRAELSKITGLSPNTVTRALTEFELLGLISRERESLGRIGSFIVLTLQIGQASRRRSKGTQRPWREVPAEKMKGPRKPAPKRRRRIKPVADPNLLFEDLPLMQKPRARTSKTQENRPKT